MRGRGLLHVTLAGFFRALHGKQTFRPFQRQLAPCYRQLPRPSRRPLGQCRLCHRRGLSDAAAQIAEHHHDAGSTTFRQKAPALQWHSPHG